METSMDGDNPEEQGDRTRAIAEQKTEPLGALDDPSTTIDPPVESASPIFSVRQGLGTFAGVFRPTVLTICGVMMYLREGWLVGQAGLLGALGLILLTFAITGTAAMSLSSITTNIRVGAGGVFSIISQSLGLEPGGAIGIPLYVGQALSAALYIYGFTEAWGYIFPEHPPVAVAYAVFVLAFAATLISTRLAFRLQGLVMIVIIASLMSIALGLTGMGQGGHAELRNPELFGSFEAGGFWILFAIFFPAGTGVNVGASMSGALANPRRSIPRGTMAAVLAALCIYVFLAFWYSMVASPQELRENALVVVDYAAFGELVLVGILASTFTATLSSLVAAPRVLQALGSHSILPRSAFFSHVTGGGEPRNAALFTGGLVAIALMLGSLDRIAVLITMFFLLTYLTINLVVLVEQSLGMISFRPTFRVPRAVPVVGAALALLAVFVISPAFALVALSVIGGIYVVLVGRRLETPWETVRSSIFVSLADWAAKRIARGPQEANERSWKPDLLVPVESRTQLDGQFRFLRLLTAPKGSLQVVGVLSRETYPESQETTASVAHEAGEAVEEDAHARYRPRRRSGEHKTIPGMGAGRLPTAAMAAIRQRALGDLGAVAADFQREGLFATAVTIEASTYPAGVDMASAVMQGSYFRPNILFINADMYDQPTLQELLDVAITRKMGAAFLFEHPESSLGHERRINVWVRDQSPSWPVGLRLANLDLSLLLGYQAHRNWQGSLRLLTVCPDPEETDNAQRYLQLLIDDARLPRSTESWVESGSFMTWIAESPRADLQIMGLADTIDRGFMERMVQLTGSSVLFVRDSGNESALA
ncbi:Na-K-Cl cotransporter [Lujinxingia sediminis]|uniref:Na-K-Cl cotransporter n=2 Tax=Lujinxingia sediminis TaxID=2480984 RepID=A0ABY0CSW6_9DELT|nr:Na-K-Cl cotransporter [Lujinxingia sediminis]